MDMLPAVSRQVARPGVLVPLLMHMQSCMPPAVLSAANPGPGRTVAEGEVDSGVATAMALRGWGWPLVSALGEPLTRSFVTVLGGAQRVKFLTAILRSPAICQRAERLRDYVASALEPSMTFARGGGPVDGGAQAAVALSVDGGVTCLLSAFKSLWALPWENGQKDAFWRLAVNGVPGAGGHDMPPARPCGCAWELPPDLDGPVEVRRVRGAVRVRSHAFWDCPVAQSVLRCVAEGLPDGVTLQRHHLWLCMPPSAVVQPAVWRVVCLAAASAIRRGQGALFAAVRAEGAVEQPAGPRQLPLHAFYPHLPGPAPVAEPPDPVVRASRVAVVDFWRRLDDFVSCVAGLRGLQRRWRGSGAVSQDHPFIARAPGGGAFRLRMPE